VTGNTATTTALIGSKSFESKNNNTFGVTFDNTQYFPNLETGLDARANVEAGVVPLIEFIFGVIPGIDYVDDFTSLFGISLKASVLSYAVDHFGESYHYQTDFYNLISFTYAPDFSLGPHNGVNEEFEISMKPIDGFGAIDLSPKQYP